MANDSDQYKDFRRLADAINNASPVGSAQEVPDVDVQLDRSVVLERLYAHLENAKQYLTPYYLGYEAGMVDGLQLAIDCILGKCNISTAQADAQADMAEAVED